MNSFIIGGNKINLLRLAANKYNFLRRFIRIRETFAQRLSFARNEWIAVVYVCVCVCLRIKYYIRFIDK